MKDWRKAMWELYWMVFYDQPRLTTFRKLVALGFTRREAAEEIQQCEREG